MGGVRRAAVAGSFYPADPAVLRAMVDGLLAEVPDVVDDAPPVALIAPHAGYIYSGPVAASAYARLRPWRDRFHRVVVVGPPHRVPVRGLALSSAAHFETPLGRIPVDLATVQEMAARRSVVVDDRAHVHEHSLEVHLPFLQRVLEPGWSLVAALAGDAPTAVLADALEPVWGCPSTLVVVSTDLSHYHAADTARRLDRDTAATILAGAWERLGSAQACGAVPVRTALELSRRHHDEVELLDLRNSADTAGPDDRVVGYGSFVVR